MIRHCRRWACRWPHRQLIASRDNTGIVAVCPSATAPSPRRSALGWQRRGIARMIESIQHAEAAPPDGHVVMEYMPARRIFVVDTGRDFYSGGIEVYEWMLHRLRDELRGRQLPDVYYSHVGTLLRREDRGAALLVLRDLRLSRRTRALF